MVNAKQVLLAHGGGGQLSHDLVLEVFVQRFGHLRPVDLDDAAVLAPCQGGRLALTTDSYVVHPLFFPGGDIGKLAVCGTVNDLSMVGATPRYLSAGFIIEEGFPIADLERIVDSMAATAREADVAIVTGDTKVVDRGSADGLFINTAGVGVVPEGLSISGDQARPGDLLLVSGPLGDHGVTIMSKREGLPFTTALQSDSAPLNGLVAEMVAVGGIHCLRDLTRGGLASGLNELAAQSGVGIQINEDDIPVRPAVKSACEMLGLDPLYVANEGRLAAIVTPDRAQAILAAMRRHRYGQEAALVGKIVADHPGRVVMRTFLGTTRIVDMLVGEQLPRIC